MDKKKEMVGKATQIEKDQLIARFQKLAKNISGMYDPVYDKILDIDRVRSVNPLSISYEKLMEMSPKDPLWITLSRLYFNEPQYQRIIMYYATLYLGYYYVSPVDIVGKVNNKKLDKEYNVSQKKYFVEEFNKGVQSLISSLGKNEDITKMTKPKLMIYNKGKAIANLLSTLDINTIAEELFNPDADVSEVIDKYAPVEADKNATEGVKSKLNTIRDSIRKNNEGKPNC